MKIITKAYLEKKLKEWKFIEQTTPCWETGFDAESKVKVYEELLEYIQS